MRNVHVSDTIQDLYVFPAQKITQSNVEFR